MFAQCGYSQWWVPEQQFFNHQAVVPEIDISQGLRRMACEAACMLKEAMTAAGEAVSQLASIQDFLDYVIVTPDLSLKPGCTLEWDAARALTNINEVLGQQASGNLRSCRRMRCSSSRYFRFVCGTWSFWRAAGISSNPCFGVQGFLRSCVAASRGSLAATSGAT